MPSTFTPNKGLEMPATGSYNDTWGPVADQVFLNTDTALGGTTAINVTGIASGTYTLSLTEYQPPNIEFSGNMSGTLVYSLPIGVGGIFTISNNTNGTANLYFGVNGVNILVRPGQRSLLVSDGANMGFADTDYANIVASQAQANSESYASTVATAAQTNAEAYAATQATTAQTNAENYAAAQASAAQAAAISSSNTYAAAQASAAQTAAITTSEAYSRSLYRSGSFTCINGTVSVTFSTPFPAGSTVIVTTMFAYAAYNAGNIVTGSVSVNGFQFFNSNSGPCYYNASIAN